MGIETEKPKFKFFTGYDGDALDSKISKWQNDISSSEYYFELISTKMTGDSRVHVMISYYLRKKPKL